MSEKLTVFAVVYGNYSPSEVDSLWTTEAKAHERKDELHTSDDEYAADYQWRVIPWEVGE